jgi:hypothetical protein
MLYKVGRSDPFTFRTCFDLGTVGTARDVSFLIDFLPSFLYPTGRMPIVEWGVAGKSLGGHAAWIALVMGKLSDRLRDSWRFADVRE